MRLSWKTSDSYSEADESDDKSITSEDTLKQVKHVSTEVKVRTDSISLCCDHCAVIMDITNGAQLQNTAKKRLCQRLQEDQRALTKETNLFFLKHTKV